MNTGHQQLQKCWNACFESDCIVGILWEVLVNSDWELRRVTYTTISNVSLNCAIDLLHGSRRNILKVFFRLFIIRKRCVLLAEEVGWSISVNKQTTYLNIVALERWCVGKDKLLLWI